MRPAARLFPLLLFLSCSISVFAAEVTLRRVPEGGIEPQVAVDSKGVVHLIYFAGEAKAGDVFHCTSSDGGKRFSKPARVNSVEKSAVIVGSVRGPRLAVDANDRPHVIWTGSDIAQPKPRLIGLPLMYAKLDGDQFTPQHHVIRSDLGIDGGASIAADGSGNVVIVWHAPATKDGDEQSRRLLLGHSTDNFASPTTLKSPSVGVCGCCAVEAFYDAAGKLRIIFRAADRLVHRDMYLLSEDSQARVLSYWRIGKCVMSTAVGLGNAFAWESQDQILVSTLDRAKPVALGKNNPKHPTLARSGDATLVAWTENTGWQRGGSVVWQLLDRDLKPLAGSTGRADDLPAWGTPAAFATPAGDFVVLY